MERARQRFLIRLCFVICALALAAILLRQLGETAASDGAVTSFADDVSRLNRTAIHELWDIPGDESAAQSGLRGVLQQARISGLHVSIAGARHSMGGQTIVPGGIRVNMLPLKSMELNEQTDLLHVDAGALWADVIPYLDGHGRSVEVMQSDNSFTVGGSLSVNCHGWQYGAASHCLNRGVVSSNEG